MTLPKSDNELDKEHIKIDFQHNYLEKLIHCINVELVSSHLDLLKHMDSLIEYTAIHFNFEEQCDAFKKSPDREQHKRIHKELLEQLRNYRGKIEKNVLDIDAYKLRSFLNVWFKTHISGFDSHVFYQNPSDQEI